MGSTKTAVQVKLPNFIIIGAMRSGTTSLTHYLRSHPEVFVAPAKELHFFDRFFEEEVAWYQAHFTGVTNGQAIGEATPDYMYDEDVPARMASLLPDARLIAIVRNPVDRAYSHYWHSRIRGKETLSFADAVAAEQKRLAEGESFTRSAHSYLDRGRYLRQLQRFCEYYPREALLVVLFEDLRDQPVETYHLICRFLGVNDRFIPDNLEQVVNEAVNFRSLAVRNWSKWLKRYPAVSLLGRVVDRLNTKRGFSYPPMDPEIRTALLAEFSADNAALASWLGRDLSIWQT